MIRTSRLPSYMAALLDTAVEVTTWGFRAAKLPLRPTLIMSRRLYFGLSRNISNFNKFSFLILY